VRDNFYNSDLEKSVDRLCLTEKKMRERGVESFKDELREVVQQEIADPNSRTFDDVIRGLKTNWNVECRVAGNTVSYKHPEYRDKNNNLVSVRGSKLGDLYTRKGIEYELNKKATARTAEHNRAVEIETVSTGGTGHDTIARNEQNAATGSETALRLAALYKRRKQAGSGGQISSSTNADDVDRDVQDLDRFYERYTKRVKDDERKADENDKLAKNIRNKGTKTR
jgi:hypothetical protein